MQKGAGSIVLSVGSDGAVYRLSSFCPWASPCSGSSGVRSGLRAGWVVLYDHHMTASVRYSATVVRNERLLLKARPRSAVSLVGGGGIEAGRRGYQSKRFCCVEQHVEVPRQEEGSRLQTCFQDKQQSSQGMRPRNGSARFRDVEDEKHHVMFSSA